MTVVSTSHLLKSLACSAILFAGAAHLHAETVKIAFIDPFSGPFAHLGQAGIHAFRATGELYQTGKNPEKTKLEFVEMDNKLSPQESLNKLKSASDQGFRYIIQGVGSGANASLIEAIGKFDDRNPGKELVQLNRTSADPELTNSKCSFWHFRLDANADMKVEAMTTYIAKDPSVKKVFLINQNIPTGQQTSRAAREYLKRKRPDIEIVGDDVVPAGQVQDFSPYVVKVQASGTDTINFMNVPYKGATPALSDAIAGHIDATVSDVGVFLPMHKEGELRIVMVTSEKRLDVLPDVPTANEDAPGLVVANWLGVFAPAKTPRLIVDKINAPLLKTVAQEEVKAAFLRASASASAMAGPEQFQKFVAAEYLRYGQLVRERHIVIGE